MELTTQNAALMSDGIAHHQAGRLGEATDRYSRVVHGQPECGEAWRLLGVVALQSSDGHAARSLLQRALRIDPSDAAAYCALGSVDESEGRLDEAYVAFSKAAALDAGLDVAAIGIARVTLALGRADDARRYAQAAIARGVKDPGLLRTLGSACLQLRDYEPAAEALCAALDLEPHADAYANLAIAYLRRQRFAAATAACADALAAAPAHAAALNTLGCIRAAEGAFPAAFAAFEEAIALGCDEAHVNLGTGLLLAGDYHAGWPHFGWTSVERRANPALSALPMWAGEPSPNRRLLLWPEQGVGDTIQMVRFVRRARAFVGSITLACQPGTRALFDTLDGVDELIETCERPAFERFDCWLPTLRLPAVFDIGPDALSPAPYLRADAARIERFRARLAAPGKLRVGLVWAGSPTHERDAFRSCSLTDLEALGEIPGIAWYALQHGPAAAQIAGTRMQLDPINADVADFADTAAIVTQLDLVICVDTSVAHVAGALGCPAWVMLAKRPDWRWQSAGERSPWYPSLRLFRQGDDGTWPPVVAALAAALCTVRASTPA